MALLPPSPAEHGAEPHATASVFAQLGARLAATADTGTAVQVLTGLAVEVVPGARWSSVSHRHHGRFRTMASSDPVAEGADRVQYELGTGPCVDAAVDHTVFVSGDLATEGRWSTFGATVASDLGVRSVLSIRLTVEGADDGLDAALNLYGDHPDAFGPDSVYLATLLATHAAVAVDSVLNREKARSLEQALQSNREIGVAMGVLMVTHRLTREQAFDLLRVASQQSNRKLRDLARDVADTGVLDLPSREPAHQRPRPPRTGRGPG